MMCRHYGTCGGCSLQHLPYAAQLAAKESKLRACLPGDLTKPGGPLADPLFLTVNAEEETPWAFRQKVAFVFGPGAAGKRLTMGHFEKGSHRIVSVEECPVHSTRANRIAFALRDHLMRAGLEAAGASRSGILRHLIIRTSLDNREAVAMLVVSRNDKSLRTPVRALLSSENRPDGFFININEDPGPFMVGSKTMRVHGLGHIRQTIGDLTYLISPATFFQTNVRAAALLQHNVVKTIRNAGTVLDLYCGSGLFSLPLAAAGASVVGIEENGQAVRDAGANLRWNRIPQQRVQFIAGRVEDALMRVARRRWDAVILDPPREGCSISILRAIFQDIAPAVVIYVSCNPEVLRTELPIILKAGYRAERIEAVDMFPHTDHMETIVRLVRVSGH